jgi:hypothetical protein
LITPTRPRRRSSPAPCRSAQADISGTTNSFSMRCCATDEPGAGRRHSNRHSNHDLSKSVCTLRIRPKDDPRGAEHLVRASPIGYSPVSDCQHGWTPNFDHFQTKTARSAAPIASALIEP